MTKKTPTRQMLITIKDLQKQLKKVKKTMFRQLPTAQKCCKKQYRIKIFVLSDQKCTHAPNANPHKLVEKTIEKWSHHDKLLQKTQWKPNGKPDGNLMET